VTALVLPYTRKNILSLETTLVFVGKVNLSIGCVMQLVFVFLAPVK